MIINIRQFAMEDYSAIAEINNVFWTEEKITTDQWRDDDAKRPPHCKHARWVAEVHGGAITIESEPGRGTVVTIRLPAAVLSS